MEPWRAEVELFAAVGKVGHDRPEIDLAATERFLRTHSGLDPLQGNSGTPGRLADGLNRKPGRMAPGSNLERRNVLKADAEGAVRDRRGSDLKIPIRESDSEPGRKGDRGRPPERT
jgi:hypothetical protein